MLAILSGTGLTQFASMEVLRRELVRTPYGEPSGHVAFGQMRQGNKCTELLFLPRHGYGRTLAPHSVNYRANMWALKEMGVTGVIAVTSVGSIRPHLVPGMLVLPDQIIDYTSGRASSYFDSTEQPVTHIDFTYPYDDDLRSLLLSAAQRIGFSIHDGGVYACTQGPRLETAAEVRRMQRDGADIVGMTGMPEAALARELGLPYASLAMVIHAAGGREDIAHTMTESDGAQLFNQTIETVHAILKEAILSLAIEVS